MENIIKILKIEQLTHDTKKFIVEKPKDYDFVSGQHTTLSINKSELEKQKKPFTIASSEDNPNLEFIIKIYSEREGITKKLDKLKVGDELVIEDPRGKIKYKGEGTFIAAGTGIAPFISIVKKLGKNKNNILIYSNKTKEDIILEDELRSLFEEVIFTLTREKREGYENGRINKEFLKEKIKDFNQNFYLCGSAKFAIELKKDLIELGVESEDIISEF